MQLQLYYMQFLEKKSELQDKKSESSDKRVQLLSFFLFSGGNFHTNHHH